VRCVERKKPMQENDGRKKSIGGKRKKEDLKSFNSKKGRENSDGERVCKL